jgi:hypothetical protein
MFLTAIYQLIMLFLPIISIFFFIWTPICSTMFCALIEPHSSIGSTVDGRLGEYCLHELNWLITNLENILSCSENNSGTNDKSRNILMIIPLLSLLFSSLSLLIFFLSVYSSWDSIFSVYCCIFFLLVFNSGYKMSAKGLHNYDKTKTECQRSS